MIFPIRRLSTIRLCAGALFVVVVIALLPARSVTQGRQSVVPEFRAAANYVQLPVRVIDSRGTLVRGLTESDFSVVEDVTSQAITMLKLVEIPVETASGSPTSP